MKASVRLLLFVALLLPFRGALAVSAWFCHTDMQSTSATTVQESADHGGCQGAGDDGQSSKHDPVCNLCSSICGAPPFPYGDAQFRGLLPSGAERFTPIAPPPAEFALGGLERPPRTI